MRPSRAFRGRRGRRSRRARGHKVGPQSGAEARLGVPSPRRSAVAQFPALSLDANTPPLRNCIPGDQVIPGLKEAIHYLSPTPRCYQMRNGFPGLPGDRAARRPDVWAQ